MTTFPNQVSSRISVVIPSHNRPDLLLKAVRSVFGQTVLPYELIVVDDGSEPPVTDDIFASAPPGLKTRLFRHSTARGAPAARNLGIQRAEAEWIAFLDDDDRFMPRKIEIITKIINEKSSLDVIYHPAEIVMIKEGIRYHSRPGILHGQDNFDKLLLKNEIGSTSLAVVRKDALMYAGLFDVQLPALQDHDLWLRLARCNARFHLINEPLTQYRYNTSSKSITSSVENRETAVKIIEEKFATEYSTLSPDKKKQYVERHLHAIVFRALLNKQIGLAFRQQYKVLKHTRCLKDLILLVFIPFGPRLIFRLRSIIS